MRRQESRGGRSLDATATPATLPCSSRSSVASVAGIRERHVAVEERLGGRHRTRIISLSVRAATVRRGQSTAAVAQAERLFAAVQLRAALQDGEALVDVVERDQLREAGAVVEEVRKP